MGWDSVTEPPAGNTTASPASSTASPDGITTTPVEAQAQDGATPAQEYGDEPVLPKVRPFNEHLYRLYAYMAINNKTYGVPDNCNLKHDSITAPSITCIISVREKFLKGELSIHGQIERDMNPQHNKQGQKWFHFDIKVSARDIQELTVLAPGSFKLGEYFNPPKDWNPTEKAFLTLGSGEVHFLMPVVPKLVNSQAEIKLKEMFKDLVELKASNKVMRFEVIIDFDEVVVGQGNPVLNRLRHKIKSDKKRNPSHYWVRDSPTAHQLRQNNILPPAARPPMSEEGLVLQLRRFHIEPLDLKIALIYCENDEHLFNRAIAAKYAQQKFAVVFQEVPGSKIKDNENDNDLPKMYTMSMKWPRDDLPRPKKGEVYEIEMPGEVPPCPPCTDPKKPQAEFVDDRDDGVTESKGGDMFKFHKTAAEKHDEAEEKRIAYLTEQNKIWRCESVQSSLLNAMGEPMMTVFRPKNQLWEGYPEVAPRVGTIVPVAENRIDSVLRNQEYISKEAPRTFVKVTKLISDQTYRDIIRTVNDFFDYHQPELEHTVLRHHLVALMTKGDITLPFPRKNFSADCGGKSHLGKFMKPLTDYQRKQCEGFSAVEHGIILVNGCPASGKTTSAYRVTLAYLTAELPAGEPRRVGLATTDTNDGVNDLGKRALGILKDPELGLKDFKIIRIHTTAGETSKFISQFVPPKYSKFFEEDTDSAYLIMKLLNEIGEKKKAERERGDRRFDSGISCIALWDAMRREMEANPGQWASLKSNLRHMKLNPHDEANSMKDILDLLKYLRFTVISKANLLLGTCDMLMRPAIVECISPPNTGVGPSILFKDEDGRSRRTKLIGLVASYPTLEYIMLIADPKQKEPFLNIANGDVAALFQKYGKYTASQSFKDMGIPTIGFYTQYRMNHGLVVGHLSKRYYNGAILDGMVGTEDPPEVHFMRKFNMAQFKVENSVAFLVLENTRAGKEEGGTSLVNLAMQVYAMAQLKALKKALDSEEDLVFNKEAFDVKVISHYLGVVNFMKMAIESELKDSRFSAHSFETIQGLEGACILRLNPNYRLTPFAGNRKDNLVANSRFKYGKITMVTSASLEPATYNQSEAYMLASPATRCVYEYHLFAQKHNMEAVISLDNTASCVCKTCGEPGHMMSDEKCAGYNKGFPSDNYKKFGHVYNKCPDPKLAPKPVREKKEKKGGETSEPKSCFRCKEPGHNKIDCPLPWCRDCNNTEHTSENCPNAVCKKCKAKGHRVNNINCPKFEYCGKCGENHSETKCTFVATLANTFKHKWEAQDGDDDLQAIHAHEAKLHRKQYPELYLDESPAEEGNGESEQATNGWGEPTATVRASKKMSLREIIRITQEQDRIDAQYNANLEQAIQNSKPVEQLSEEMKTVLAQAGDMKSPSELMAGAAHDDEQATRREYAMLENAVSQKQFLAPKVKKSDAQLDESTSLLRKAGFNVPGKDGIILGYNFSLSIEQAVLPWGYDQSYYALTKNDSKRRVIFCSPAQPKPVDPRLLKKSPDLVIESVREEGPYYAAKTVNINGQQVIVWEEEWESKDYLPLAYGIILTCVNQVAVQLSMEEFESLHKKINDMEDKAKILAQNAKVPADFVWSAPANGRTSEKASPKKVSATNSATTSSQWVQNKDPAPATSDRW